MIEETLPQARRLYAFSPVRYDDTAHHISSKLRIVGWIVNSNYLVEISAWQLQYEQQFILIVLGHTPKAHFSNSITGLIYDLRYIGRKWFDKLRPCSTLLARSSEPQCGIVMADFLTVVKSIGVICKDKITQPSIYLSPEAQTML